MKLLNRCIKVQEQLQVSIQLTITSIIIIIISHSNAPLYNSVVSLQITICNDIDGEHNYGVTLYRVAVVHWCG